MASEVERAFVSIFIFQEWRLVAQRSAPSHRPGVTIVVLQPTGSLLVGMRTRAATLKNSFPISPEVKHPLLI